MLNLEEVRAFFDERASKWDTISEADDQIVNALLDFAGVGENMRILDVACGTGVLIPYYLRRKVHSVTAIDLSPEMIRVAREKCSASNVRFITGDVMETKVGGPFDAVVIYNALPHFSDPEGLIIRCAGMLKEGGKLSVAHGSSRASIDAHHKNEARAVSMGLMEAETLASLFKKYLNVTAVVSDDRMYTVVGEKPYSS